MKKNKILYFMTFLMIYFMIFISLINAARYFVKVIGIDWLNKDSSAYDYIYADDLNMKEAISMAYRSNGNAIIDDWKSVYPFEGEELIANDKKNDYFDSFDLEYFWSLGFVANDGIVTFANTITDTLEWETDLYTGTYSAQYFAGGKENIENDTASLIEEQNGFWINIMEERNPGFVADNIYMLKKYLDEKNIDLVYVQAPPKAEQISSGIYQDNSDKNIDELNKKLDDYNINHIDLRERYKIGNYKKTDMFWGTDHHWNTLGALDAAKATGEYINSKIGINSDTELLDKNQFEIKEFGNILFGSYAEQLTKAKAKEELFYINIPKSDKILFNYEAPSKGIFKEGSFEECFIDDEMITAYAGTPRVYYSLGYESEYSHVTNKNIDNECKVLVLGDSYGTSYYPYISILYKEVLYIDNRTFNGSIKTLINDYNPNIVIVLSAVSSIVDPEVSDTNIMLWDFN